MYFVLLLDRWVKHNTTNDFMQNLQTFFIFVTFLLFRVLKFLF